MEHKNNDLFDFTSIKGLQPITALDSKLRRMGHSRQNLTPRRQLNRNDDNCIVN